MQDKTINTSGRFFTQKHRKPLPRKSLPLIIWGDNHGVSTNCDFLRMQLEYLHSVGYRNFAHEFDEDLKLEDLLSRSKTTVKRFEQSQNRSSFNTQKINEEQFFNDLNIAGSRLALYQKIKDLEFNYQGIDLNLLEYRGLDFTSQDIIVNGKKYPAPGFTKELYSDRNINLHKHIYSMFFENDTGDIAYLGLRHLIGLEDVGLADLLAESLGSEVFDNNVIFIHVVEPNKDVLDIVHENNRALSERLAEKGFKFNSYILDKGPDVGSQFRKIIDSYLAHTENAHQNLLNTNSGS